MKLVQKPLTTCISVVCLLVTFAIQPLAGIAQNVRQTAPRAYFDPTKGFKSAQRNLTEILLQIAGSLEHHGSPAPYLRHIQSEELRVARQYKLKTGHDMPSCRPADMTDAYIDRLISNWDVLSSKLNLDGLAREAGICTRKAIGSSNDTGTPIIDILNEHQRAVVACMEKGTAASFESLRTKLAAELEFDLPQDKEQALVIVLERENALSEAERKEYGDLLRHERFSKAEFGLLDHFYRNGYDKLTEKGKYEMSKRIWSGTHTSIQNTSRQDAIRAANTFRGKLTDIFTTLDSSLEQQKSAKLKSAISSVFIDLGRMAQTELELGVLEQVLKQ